MAVIKLGDLTTFAGDPSGSYLVINDSTNTATYKIQREALIGNISFDSSSLATTGSNVFNGTQTINGNLFMSGAFRLVYNNDPQNNLLFGLFDGSTIHGPYYQLFGNQYPNLSQRGGAEFIYDVRNNPDANFHIASFNGSSWTQKFLVNDTGVQVTGSLNVSDGITGSLEGTASYALTASYLEGSVQPFPYTGSAQITGSLGLTGSLSITENVTASNALFTGNIVAQTLVVQTVSSSGFTGSLLGSASYVTASNVFGPFGSNSVISSSYALTASFLVGAVSANVNIQDDGVPQGSAGTLNFTGAPISATVAGGIATINFVDFDSGSVALHTQASPSVTWSFNHNLNNNYPVINFWDSNNFSLIPGGIKSVDANNLEIYFEVGQSGYASAMVGGNATSSYAISSGYVTSSNVYGPYGSNSVVTSSYAITASYLQGPTRISGSLEVTGSVILTDFLTLSIKNPLPTSNVLLASIMASGSGTDLKPYFWNGITWTPLF